MARASAESTWTAVLSSKFIAPAPYAGAIYRGRIARRIQENSRAQVILLQAPAGHGKSTTLQQLKASAQTGGEMTGWLTFDSGDNDSRRFVTHLQSLVRDVLTHGDAAPSDPGSRIHNGGGSPSEPLFAPLGRVGRRVSIFLDELQTLTDPSVLARLERAFEQVPRSVRIYLGSRSLPNVGLARLVEDNRALIIQSDALRFSAPEVEQFFAAGGDLGVDINEIAAIYKRTEGWPAALQLFRLALGSPIVRDSLSDDHARAPRELAEYLTENVLALQTPRVQKFLLQTSVLTRLSASLCDEVLRQGDSGEVLSYLEQSGLFLRRVDPGGAWYKYHSLFSSILAEQLTAQHPDLALRVHRGAAHWFMQRGLFEETVSHAIASREHSLAADALNLWSSHLVADAHLRTVEYWSEQLPWAEIANRPDLAIKCAYALVFLRRRQRAKRLLDVLRGWSGTGNVGSTTDPNIVLSMAAIAADDIQLAAALSRQVALNSSGVTGFAAFELAAISNLRSYCALASQDFEGARHHLGLARTHNLRVDAAFSRGYTSALSGVALLIQGELGRALEHFEESERSLRTETEKSCALAALHSGYVWALYEANELEAAEAVFVRNQEVIGESMRTDFLTVAYLSMARASDARGRTAQAGSYLDEAEAIGRDSGWERLVRAVKWERVRRELQRGAVDQAADTAATARAGTRLRSEWIPFADDLEDEELGEIRLALARGLAAEAGVRIRTALQRERGRILRRIKLQLLLAVQASLCGDRRVVRRELRGALRLARAGGFVSCVLDAGEDVLQLMREEYQGLLKVDRLHEVSGDELEFLGKLLRLAGARAHHSGLCANAASSSLTERERELLVLLAKGTSNKTVANQLFVSENTVKFHLKNIYAKLAVSSRVRALTAAREMGIIQ